LLVILPITSKGKGIRSHIPAEPASTGLKTKSFIISDQPRTISKERLGKRIGQVPPAIVDQVEHVLRILLQL
jgi:mRNA interferase MazF